MLDSNQLSETVLSGVTNVENPKLILGKNIEMMDQPEFCPSDK
jgi:hypothetical protein